MEQLVCIYIYIYFVHDSNKYLRVSYAHRSRVAQGIDTFSFETEWSTKLYSLIFAILSWPN